MTADFTSWLQERYYWSLCVSLYDGQYPDYLDMGTIVNGIISESTPTNTTYAVRMAGISKQYPGILANDNVNLNIIKGTLHAVIGENGAGKSTLLGILYGSTLANSGTITINEVDVTHQLRSPADAIEFGIGMVSQHYSLIPALSVLENCILGAEPTFASCWIDRKKAAIKINRLVDQLGLSNINLDALARSLSIPLQQKVEILKSLYRGADILLLDEPTAALAPSESTALFKLLQQLVSMGTTVVYITHKLKEVMSYSESITVLRSGKSVAQLRTENATEEELLSHMMGKRIQKNVAALNRIDTMGIKEHAENSEIPAPRMLLQLNKITALNSRRALALRGVSLNIHKGEIVGVAGVEGSGQRELAEALVGVSTIEEGEIIFEQIDISRCSIQERHRRGIAYIPEDRNRAGLIPSLSVADNYLLGSQRDSKWGGGMFLNSSEIMSLAERMISACDIRTGHGGAKMQAGSLSGGNQQKLLVARALKDSPQLVIACQPTRGLDREAAKLIYKIISEAVSRGMSVILFSSDIDELFEISDRILVMFNQRIAGEVARDNFAIETIGALMTGTSIQIENVTPA